MMQVFKDGLPMKHKEKTSDSHISFEQSIHVSKQFQKQQDESSKGIVGFTTKLFIISILLAVWHFYTTYTASQSNHLTEIGITSNTQNTGNDTKTEANPVLSVTWCYTILQVLRLQNRFQNGIQASMSSVVGPLLLEILQANEQQIPFTDMQRIDPRFKQDSSSSARQSLNVGAPRPVFPNKPVIRSIPTRSIQGSLQNAHDRTQVSPANVHTYRGQHLREEYTSKVNPKKKSITGSFRNEAQQRLVPEVPSISSVSGYARSMKTTRLNEQSIGRYTRKSGIEIMELDPGKFICRIHSIGRLQNGTLLLPKWMDKHQYDLNSKCGLSNPSFIIEGENEWPSIKVDAKRFSHIMNAQDIIVHQNNCDLYSQDTPRYHMPHFLTDMILPMLQLQTFLGPPVNYPTTWITMEGETTKQFASSPHLPCMIMPFQLWEGSPSSWVPRVAQFFLHPKLQFSFLPENTDTDPKSSGRLKKNITLFRSIVTTNMNPYQPTDLFGSDGNNLVFRLNGISRDFAWRSVKLEGNSCHIKVTVLTRKGPRELLHLDQLRQEVLRRAQSQGIKVDFQVVDFSNNSFEEQVKIAQETSVLIGTHGAGNANIAFMKPHSTLIEIFPFSYRAGPFDGFADIFKLNYKANMATPQTKTFKECMKEMEKDDKTRNEVFRLWDKAVTEEKKSPWVHRLEFEKEFEKESGANGKSEGIWTRVCARAQQLEFNVAVVAQQAAHAGNDLCSNARREFQRRRMF